MFSPSLLRTILSLTLGAVALIFQFIFNTTKGFFSAKALFFIDGFLLLQFATAFTLLWLTINYFPKKIVLVFLFISLLKIVLNTLFLLEAIKAKDKIYILEFMFAYIIFLGVFIALSISKKST